MLQNRIFFAWASRSGFGAAISEAIARSFLVFCNSVSADRIVVAASRLLGAAAACVILLSFAAEDRIVLEWLHQGCESDLSADLFNFGVNNFPFKISFKKCFKIVFFSLWRRDPVLELQIVVYWERLCASFVVQSSTGEYSVQVLWYKVVLGSNFCQLCSAK